MWGRVMSPPLTGLSPANRAEPLTGGGRAKGSPRSPAPPSQPRASLAAGALESQGLLSGFSRLSESDLRRSRGGVRVCDFRSSPSLPGKKRAAGSPKPLLAPQAMPSPGAAGACAKGHGWWQGAGGRSGAVPAPGFYRWVTVTGAVWGHPLPRSRCGACRVKAGSISPPAVLGQVAEPRPDVTRVS